MISRPNQWSGVFQSTSLSLVPFSQPLRHFLKQLCFDKKIFPNGFFKALEIQLPMTLINDWSFWQTLKKVAKT